MGDHKSPVGAQLAAQPVHPLTRRELEVLQLICAGLTTNEIGGRLGIKFKTAACHRNRLIAKAGVRNTVQLLRWAIRQGLLEP
jgi:DNA-binding CsgD family transcriptional regulator